MSKEEKKPKGARSAKLNDEPTQEVRAPDYLSAVTKHLTESLCEEVFAATRDRERQRKWTLFTLVWFWIGLLQTRFASQTRAILEAQKGHPLLPDVDASPESFFMKIQAVRPVFFRNVFSAFTLAIQTELSPCFATDLGIDEKTFPEVYAADGSRLEKVGRLLKITRTTTKAILPGSMEALYDVRRGILRDLWFDPDGFASEISMFDQIIGSLPRGALLLADRYYPKPVIWRDLASRGLFMVSRYNKTVKKRKLETLSRKRSNKINVDDWLVEMGGSQYGTVPITLRWVHVWNGDFDLVLITNVLDPKILSPIQLVGLYRRRWTVERMYLAMKDVLELNHLYNCSPAAVGQQTYATAILYNALRLAQSKMATTSGIPADDLSVEKLFPALIENLIKATYMEVGAEDMFERLKKYNPGLKWPGFEANHPTLNLTVAHFRVEKRKGHRKKRRFCQGRKGQTSFGKIPGAKRFLRN